MEVKILLHYSLAYPVSDDPDNPEGPLDGSYSILLCTCTQDLSAKVFIFLGGGLVCPLLFLVWWEMVI